MPTDELTRAADWWLKTGTVYGLGFILIAAIVAFCVYMLFYGSRGLLNILSDIREYIQQVFHEHMDFMRQLRELGERNTKSGERTADAMEALAETHAKTSADIAAIDSRLMRLEERNCKP